MGEPVEFVLPSRGGRGPQDRTEDAQQQAQTVQTIEKSEGDVKVRERKDDPEERRRKKKDRDARGGGEKDDGQSADSGSSGSRGGLDFLA